MTDLTEAINAFLAKYPDDADLTWRDRPRKRDALDVMVADLVTAGERWRRRTKPDPEPLLTPATRSREPVTTPPDQPEPMEADR